MSQCDTAMLQTKYAISVTVIIATRNRADRLSETLAQLQAQVPISSWEVIVADNGSQDETQQVLARWSTELPLRPVLQPVPGKNRALNLALAHARGEFLVFTDDDVLLDPCWLKTLVRAARSWPAYDIFCGPINPLWPEGTPEWLKDHPFATQAFAKFAPALSEGPLESGYPFGPNVAVRAAAMEGVRFTEAIGPRDANDGRYPLGDETNLFRRLKARGHKTVFVPTAPVGHYVEPHQLDVKWLLARSFRAGRGRAVNEPDRSAVKVLGVPRYLLKMLAVTWVRQAFARRQSTVRQLDLGLELQFLLGQLYEYRHPVRVQQPQVPGGAVQSQVSKALTTEQSQVACR